MSDLVDLPFASYPGGGRELLGRPHGDVARRGYGRDILAWCGLHCVYCGLDMSKFEGWLQLSVDHVVPQQAIGMGIPADWVLDRTNLVACCRSCNDLFNRDPGVSAVPPSLEAFLELRDASFLGRRARIKERRAAEHAWFKKNVARPSRDSRE
jgi:5-methylcytosine-specific restriction endonuclease McrA